MNSYVDTIPIMFRCLTKNCTGIVRIEVLRPVCVELYGECKELGRFMLRSSGHTIAAGVVTKVKLIVTKNLVNGRIDKGGCCQIYYCLPYKNCLI